MHKHEWMMMAKWRNFSMNFMTRNGEKLRRLNEPYPDYSMPLSTVPEHQSWEDDEAWSVLWVWKPHRHSLHLFIAHHPYLI
jgi:hypothetical protein